MIDWLIGLLIDWLSTEFITEYWTLKTMHLNAMSLIQTTALRAETSGVDDIWR